MMVIKMNQNWCFYWCLVLSLNEIIFGESIIKEPSAVLESIVVTGNNGNNENVNMQTATEILELPHAFRHQQHYAHRIEQAVNDFKLQQKRQQQLQQQQQQQQEEKQQSHLKERDKNASATTTPTATTTMRTKTIMLSPWTTESPLQQQQQQQQHQRRHQHHWLKQQQQQREQHHHLRHRHHHYQQITNDNELVDDDDDDLNENNYKNLLHLTTSNNNNKTTTKPTRRYFDRDGLFRYQQQQQQQQNQLNDAKYLYQDPVTRGPNINHNMMRHRIHTPFTITTSTTKSPRLSLSYNSANNGLFDIDNSYEEFNDDEDLDDELDDDDDDDDDNIFDYDDENKTPILDNLQSKATIKRFTNPFRQQDTLKEADDEETGEKNFWNRRLEHIKRHYLAQQEHRKELKALIAKHGGNVGLNKQQHKKQASYFFSSLLFLFYL